MREIADEVGCVSSWVDMAHYAGPIAAGVYPNPMPHAHAGHQHHLQDAARPRVVA